MRFSPRLRADLVPAGEQPERLFVELWRLRAEVIDLRPEVAPEVDYAAFRGYFDADTQIILYRGAGGIEGFYGFRSRRIDTPRGPRIRLDPEYGFSRPVARDHLVRLLAVGRVFRHLVRRHGWHPFVMVGAGYPPWVLSVGRIASRVRGLRDPDLEDWERDTLTDCMHTMWGPAFDPERQLVRLRTRPPEPRREPRTRRGRALLAWYESHNPDWRDSWGLPVLLAIDTRSVIGCGPAIPCA